MQFGAIHYPKIIIRMCVIVYLSEEFHDIITRHHVRFLCQKPLDIRDFFSFLSLKDSYVSIVSIITEKGVSLFLSARVPLFACIYSFFFCF